MLSFHRRALRLSATAIRLSLSVAVGALGCFQAVPAQAPHPVTPAEQQQIEALLHRMTLEQKIDYIGGTGFAVRAVPELNLPAIEMSDGPYGVRSNAGLPSTTFAAGIGLAASWDRGLAAQVGAGIGRDARARGVNYMLGPGTNIYRSPRNGRNFEYFGEDPFLAGQIVTGYVTGMQQMGVSATVKHYLGNNSEFLRHDSDTILDERTAREIYLPAFEAAVKQGHVGAVMDSYNLINGQHATENAYFNTQILRKEWGFEGTLMSDWDATYSGVNAANGGLDIEMPTGKFMNRANLLPAVKAGTVAESTIDEKVRHLLATAMMFGWLNRPQRDASISLFDNESNETALKAAREAPVLLKNDGDLLPLNPAKVRTILLVGPQASQPTPVGGGSAGVVPFHAVSLLEGISGQAPAVKVLYDRGLVSLTELALQTNFQTAPTGGKPGLIFETFSNRDLAGTPHESVVEHINVAGVGWDALATDPEAFMEMVTHPSKTSRRYTGYFTAPRDGNYLLALAAAGEGNGERVSIDGKLVIDNWTLMRAFEPHLTLPLTAGTHKVVVESWQDGFIGNKLRLAIVPEGASVTEQAKKLAAQADVVIVAAGFVNTRDFNSESEGGDRTFDLPYGQDELIQAMAKANPRTVVIVTSGGNVDSSSWIGQVPALLEAWYGGQAGGQAQAEILFGKTNPSGHLPATFERRAEDNPTFKTYYPQGDSKRVVYSEGIFVGYRGYEHNHTTPLFPFGFGLSYTTFQFAHLSVKRGAGETFATVDFDVTNTGKRSGAEVAQVYVTDTHAPVPRPAHELKGFERVELKAGETRHVSVKLDARAFAYYDVDHKGWAIAPGQFTISAGDSVASLPLSGTIDLDAKTIAGAKF